MKLNPEKHPKADIGSAAPSVFRVDPRDDVAVALRDLAPGEQLAFGQGLIVGEPIRAAHKIALHAIAKGALVKKCGWPIGQAVADISAGFHVHSHNLQTLLSGAEQYEFTPDRTEKPAPPRPLPSFEGYIRQDGRVATRNEIWVLPTVGCVARTAERIARIGNTRYKNRIDGIYAFPHPFGCSQLGDDLDRTRKVLAALAMHPNAGGALVIGLGCESNQLEALLGKVTDGDRARIRAFSAQATDDEMEAGVTALEALVQIAERDRRTQVPLSSLTLGLKCGGSDGLSGLTANPVVGVIATLLAEAGGTPILTETPEMFGAERILMARACDQAVFNALVKLVNDFKRYFLDHGLPVYENPSPGNIEGGITTLEEKSLGAIQKAGRAAVAQVLRYGDRAQSPGLTVLEAPGNDAVSVTALVAAGATLILFTTGRGTPLGSPVPTLKVSSNTAVAERKKAWIDFDAGRALSGSTIEGTAHELMRLMLNTASGEPARNEINEERDIAIWKGGVTL